MKNLVKKTKAWNTYLGAKSFSNWTLYKKICNSVTNAIKISKINFAYKLFDDIHDNPKGFFEVFHINSKEQGKLRILFLWLECRFLDTEDDGSNAGISMSCP